MAWPTVQAIRPQRSTGEPPTVWSSRRRPSLVLQLHVLDVVLVGRVRLFGELAAYQGLNVNRRGVRFRIALGLGVARRRKVRQADRLDHQNTAQPVGHLASLAGETRTLVFYESAHRIEDALADCVVVFGAERPAVLARELTKLFETVLDGTLGELQAKVQADPDQRKGEFVLLVQGAGEDAEAKVAEGRRLYAKLCEHLKPSQAAKLAAELSGAPRKALYGGEGG